MDRLRLIEVFRVVAQTRSFTAAAEHLGMSRASVTKHVAMLERNLGARLLDRTTKHVAPTAAGLWLIEGGSRLLRDFEVLEAGVRDAMHNPRGTIRVGTPPSFGATYLVPAVAAFTERHPEIHVVLHHDDGTADLVRDSLELSIRIATSLKSTSHIARLLARAPQVLVASPDYLTKHGTPRTLDDLRQHNCLVHRIKSPTALWRFGHGSSTSAVEVSGTLSANFGEALHMAALSGHGIAMHPTYMVHDDIRAKRLVVVLPDVAPVSVEIHAVYLQRMLPVRVRKLVEFLREWLPREARWLQDGPID